MPMIAAAPKIPKLTKFWPLYVIGRCGNTSCKLAERHETGGEGQEAEQGFDDQGGHLGRRSAPGLD